MIRKATPCDFDFIYELYMHPDNNRFLLYEQMDKGEFHPVYDDLLSKAVLYVYESDGKPAGMFKLVPQHYRDAHKIYLGGLAIHPDFTGQGKGTKMMEAILSFCKQRNFLRIELSSSVENEKAIRLYERCGFVKEGVMKKFTFLESENRFMDEVMMAYLV